VKSVKFGICTSIENAALAQQAGFDFIECTVTSLMNDNFNEVKNRYDESPIPIEACNVFLPGDLQLTGEKVDADRIAQYVDEAMARVKQIGAKVIVFGSGGARSFPTNFSREKAEEQLIQFLHIVADHAEVYGITVVIEPLNKKESNIINSVPEAVDLAKRIERPSIRVLADFYHMDQENENLENIILAKDFIHHIHVADTGRLAPGTGSYPYTTFVNTVKQANYQGRISIECGWNDLEKEIFASRNFLEKIFQEKVR
jgi:sugar phosphate isomerase/epimerase